jgi:hypothetical protein
MAGEVERRWLHIAAPPARSCDALTNAYEKRDTEIGPQRQTPKSESLFSILRYGDRATRRKCAVCAGFLHKAAERCKNNDSLAGAAGFEPRHFVSWPAPRPQAPLQSWPPIEGIVDGRQPSDLRLDQLPPSSPARLVRPARQRLTARGGLMQYLALYAPYSLMEAGHATWVEMTRREAA